MNAIQLCLSKAISSSPYQKGSRCENIKSLSIDVPCSPSVFKHNFVSNVPLLDYSGQDNYKCTVSPSDLENVLGKDWDTFIYRGSNTMHRILGLIIIHYMKKVFSGSFNELR